jgi:hypothetical protein
MEMTDWCVVVVGGELQLNGVVQVHPILGQAKGRRTTTSAIRWVNDMTVITKSGSTYTLVGSPRYADAR